MAPASGEGIYYAMLGGRLAAQSVDELVRTGAFERKVLCFASPTGSGYINYVLSEALEYMTLGDCATFTMQYSLLPSPMSLTRTRLAVEQNRDLMHAVTGYLRGMAPERRPRLVLFGESLGALTMQDVWKHRTVEAIDRDFVHSSIFLGTPSATEFAKGWRLNPEKVDPDGKVFDQGERAPLQVAGVIPGFTKALEQMQKGGKYQVMIPAAAGYGDKDNGPIPANSDLYFDIDLLGFMDFLKVLIRLHEMFFLMRKALRTDGAQQGRHHALWHHPSHWPDLCPVAGQGRDQHQRLHQQRQQPQVVLRCAGAAPGPGW